MSCGCNPCSDDESGSCDPLNESLLSTLNNFITSFYGTLTKTCVNGEVVWTLPCNLDSGDPSFPRDPNEGVSCYFLRFVQTFLAAQQFAVGNKGYESTVLTNTDETLFRNSDVVNQDYTGTLTGPVDIALSSNSAINGDEFYLSFTNVVISPTNNLEIKSDATSLLLLNSTGTVNGYLKAVYTGTIWKLTTTIINIT